MATFLMSTARGVILHPIRAFAFDAAVLFSDIPIIPHALGQRWNDKHSTVRAYCHARAVPTERVDKRSHFVSLSLSPPSLPCQARDSQVRHLPESVSDQASHAQHS